MAPEVLTEMCYTPLCDVYSLGVLTFILLSGTMPFNKSNKGKILVRFLKFSRFLRFFVGSIVLFCFCVFVSNSNFSCKLEEEFIYLITANLQLVYFLSNFLTSLTSLLSLHSTSTLHPNTHVGRYSDISRSQVGVSYTRS